MDGNLTRPGKAVPAYLASTRETARSCNFGGHHHDLELSLGQAKSSEASRRTA